MGVAFQDGLEEGRQEGQGLLRVLESVGEWQVGQDKDQTRIETLATPIG